MSDMPAGSRHWRCTIHVGELGVDHAELSTYFSQGPALEREPQIEDVLDCLASDAAGFENARSFDEWASEYGYDTDSRKAETIYKTVGRQAAELKKLLGDEAYNTLLWKTERE